MMTKVVLMSGVPGSGKSTHIKKFASENSTICSADHYFMREGKYEFDPSLLGEAHASCMRKFIDCLNALAQDPYLCCDYLIVDNTNTSELELAPYVAVAAAFRAQVEIITVLCHPQDAADRNVHGVPPNAVKAMDQRLRNRKLPPFWDVKQTTVET